MKNTIIAILLMSVADFSSAYWKHLFTYPPSVFRDVDHQACLEKLENNTGHLDSSVPLKCISRDGYWWVHYWAECPYPFYEINGSCRKFCPASRPLLSKVTGVCYSNQPSSQCSAGNPVLIQSGEKVQKEVPDYVGSTIFPLNFQRYYGSGSSPDAEPSISAELRFAQTGEVNNFQSFYSKGWVNYDHLYTYFSIYPVSKTYLKYRATQKIIPSNKMPATGYKQWRHSYDYSLLVADETKELILHRPNGYPVVFYKNESGYSPLIKDGKGSITRMMEHWYYSPDSETKEIYNGNGQLVRIEKNANLYQALAYDDEGRLSSVEHSLGGAIAFTYNADQQLDVVSFPDGSQISHAYDDFGNPVSITKTTHQNAVTVRQYHYEDSRHPYALTGVTDERGVRYASWSYDELGRAVESRHGEDLVDLTSFNYEDPDAVVVTNPLGKETIYRYSNSTGVSRLTAVEGVQSDNCEAANQFYTYDESGFIESVTDWNGNTTNYTRNDRGLEVSRTEAAGTPQERTITTEWHPDFPLKTKITESDRITTFEYDDTGRLIHQTVMPTNTQ